MQEVRFRSKENNYPKVRVDNVCSALNVTPVMAKALLDRGIVDRKSARRYLNPAADDLLDPSDLPDIGKAIDRIKSAIANYERICIYGDYDTDGVCATAILYKQLKRMNAMVECFVPSRHENGYGMHVSTVELLCENGIDLIITVDNGITAVKEIELCSKYGVDVIVTDHHLPQETLPECVAVVAASRKDSAYAFPYLCGAAVAFKLACALSGETDHELLALAAVATVADVVPLIGENRTIVQLGLPYVRNNLGLTALLDVSGVDSAVDAQTVGFSISPRINAAGRLGDAGRAIALLTSETAEEAIHWADVLQSENENRKAEEQRVVEEIKADQELSGSKIIIIRGADWNPGVLGIVASRILEKYYRPVILFTEQNGNLVGSGRSIPGVHLHNAVEKFKEYFVKFGGHERAVGITLKKEAFDRFRDGISAFMEENYDDSFFVKEYEYEQTLFPADISVKLTEELQRLEPFGEGNPEPVFRITGTRLNQVRLIGQQNDHVNGTLGDPSGELKFIYFRAGSHFGELSDGQKKEVLFNLRLNTFRGKTSPQLCCVCVRSDGNCLIKNRSEFIRNMLYNNEDCAEKLTELVNPHDGELFTREKMTQEYTKTASCCGNDPGRSFFESAEDQTLCALGVFLELGFFKYENERLVKCTQVKHALEESVLYRKLI